MGFLDVIDVCDNFPQHDYNNPGVWETALSQSWRFCLPGDDRAFGYLIPAIVARMPWTPEFKLDKASQTIRLIPEDDTDLAASCSKAMTRLVEASRQVKSFANIARWPGEKFPVLGAPFPFAIDRAMAPYFGTLSTGSQMTIFVRDENRSVAAIWVARRATDKSSYPGMLDNAVGGGLNWNETPFEGLLREAKEELGIDATSAVSGGAISWYNIKDANAGTDPGLMDPGVQYVYDLEIDAKTVLRPAEDSIDWLRLLSVDDIKAALHRQEFKPSCACVMIDFFVRHGIINAESDRDFAEIVSRLHRRLPVPMTP